MEKINKSAARTFFTWSAWIYLVLAGLFILLVIIRAIHFFNEDTTNAQVAKIHAARITLEDVMGDNLPPDPEDKADETVAGVDLNENGIRDDVELAIFEEYPDSARTRAALLQYALALQMEFVQPFIDTTIVDKVVGEQSRASYCIADSLVPRKSPDSDRDNADMEKIDQFIGFVEDRQLNTNARRETQNNFYKKLGNFANSTKATVCDIDYLKLPN